jgi:hypothetical protein
MPTPRRPAPQQEEKLDPVLARPLVDACGQQVQLCLPPRYQPGTALGVYDAAQALLGQAFSAELASCISAAVYSNNRSRFVNQQFDASRLACITAGGSVVTAATYRVISHSTQGQSLMVRAQAALLPSRRSTARRVRRARAGRAGAAEGVGHGCTSAQHVRSWRSPQPAPPPPPAPRSSTWPQRPAGAGAGWRACCWPRCTTRRPPRASASPAPWWRAAA